MPEIATTNQCARCCERNFHFDSVTALGVYRDALQEAVVKMKKKYYEALALAVGRLMAEALGTQILERAPDRIVPMPIHWTRRWSRGMNVPELLAESLHRTLGIKQARGAVDCRRKLRKQGTLGLRARETNVKGAFRVSGSRDIKDARILLVDDVMTTGATASEVAGTLKKSGASRVDVVIAARALGMD